MRLTMAFALAGSLALAGCNEEQSDLAYAAWGLNDRSPRVETYEIHDKDGIVLKRQMVTATAQPIDDCHVTVSLSGTMLDAETGKNIIAPDRALQVDFRAVRDITFEWQPHPFEAVLMADPKHKPSYVPRNYLITHLVGDHAACEVGGSCLTPKEYFAFIGDTSVMPERMLAAFRRVKAMCPSADRS